MCTLNQLKDIQTILLHTREVVSRRVAKGGFLFNGPEDVSPLYGLCSAVVDVQYYLEIPQTSISSWMKVTWTQWPEYSGKPSYPVPHTKYHPAIAYDTTTSMWDKLTSYGKARRRLLDWLILQVERQIKEMEDV